MTVFLFVVAWTLVSFGVCLGWGLCRYWAALTLDHPSDVLDRLGEALDHHIPAPPPPRNLRLLPAEPEFVDARARGWT